ncbi:MAG: phosphoribosyltransferase family protein [Bacillota bacterium]|nr:phosphoribosyltransferase family protein [Bacillota bacterium]
MNNFAFDDVLSCCIYGDYPRSIVYELKSHGRTFIAKDLGRLLADRIKLSYDEDDLKVDLLVPVPCSKKKKHQRGFNQAELISQFISKETNIPTAAALEKIQNTKASKQSRGIERYFVQRGAFAITKGCNVAGKRILIVDDVITTGSTADECARTLKNAGATWVGVLCFASSAM